MRVPCDRFTQKENWKSFYFRDRQKGQTAHTVYAYIKVTIENNWKEMGMGSDLELSCYIYIDNLIDSETLKVVD